MVRSVDVDGVSPLLFQLLAKETRRMECARLFIPSTIVFDHGLAAQWYHSTSQMEVKRRSEKEITATEIFRELTEHAGTADDIVAAFYRVVDVESDASTHVPQGRRGTQTITTFMGRAELHSFLFLPSEKASGVLQQFLYPKGWCSTSIVATWSPRVTIIEALRNPLMLFDKTKTVAQRGATLESALSTQVTVTGSVSTAVRLLCDHLVRHLLAIDNLTVTGMVAHFKVDRDNRVVLLFCTSMRAKVEGSIFEEAVTPLNLHYPMVDAETYLHQHRLRTFINAKKAAAAERERREAAGASSPQLQQPTFLVSPSSFVAKGNASLARPRTLSPLPPPSESHQAPLATSVSSSLHYGRRAIELGYRPPKGRKSALVLPSCDGPARFDGTRWVPLRVVVGHPESLNAARDASADGECEEALGESDEESVDDGSSSTAMRDEGDGEGGVAGRGTSAAGGHGVLPSPSSLSVHTTTPRNAMHHASRSTSPSGSCSILSPISRRTPRRRTPRRSPRSSQGSPPCNMLPDTAEVDPATLALRHREAEASIATAAEYLDDVLTMVENEQLAHGTHGDDRAHQLHPLELSIPAPPAAARAVLGTRDIVGLMGVWVPTAGRECYSGTGDEYEDSKVTEHDRVISLRIVNRTFRRDLAAVRMRVANFHKSLRTAHGL